MSNPQDLLERALKLIDAHLLQIGNALVTADEKGRYASLSASDSQVIERYSKLLITLTKKSDPDADLEGATEAELEAIANGQDNASTEMGNPE